MATTTAAGELLDVVERIRLTGQEAITFVREQQELTREAHRGGAAATGSRATGNRATA